MTTLLKEAFGASGSGLGVWGFEFWVLGLGFTGLGLRRLRLRLQGSALDAQEDFSGLLLRNLSKVIIVWVYSK